MQINNNKSKQNFEMSFKYKSDIVNLSNGEKVLSKDKYFQYAIKDKTTLKGHKQLCKEQNNLHFVDLYFDANDNSVQIIRGNKIYKKISAYDNGETGFNTNGKNFPGKKLLMKIFNPKQFLPKNIYEGGELAKAIDNDIRNARILRQKFNEINSLTIKF